MAKNSRNRYILLASLLVVGLAIPIGGAIVFLRLGDTLDAIGASRFGMHTFTFGNGEHVYVKREVRGQNYDVIAISKNSDECKSADPATDIIFRYGGNPISVSESPDHLTVFRTGQYEKPKQQFGDVFVQQSSQSVAQPAEHSIESGKVETFDILLDATEDKRGKCAKNR